MPRRRHGADRGHAQEAVGEDRGVSSRTPLVPVQRGKGHEGEDEVGRYGEVTSTGRYLGWRSSDMIPYY